jgi:aryl-alcohol dehydrogenase-like predicted oxidoreductase
MTQPASHSVRALGNSDLQLTPIGLGAWAIGGGRSAQQVTEIAPALEFRLSEEEFARIDAFIASNPV